MRQPIELFHNLKQEVLLTYQKHYPYFEGDWKTFSSQDIQNLIGLIETGVKQTVSEKWIYTHLKPETNEKLPRKDMLDILSQWVGYSGWDEYVFKHKATETTTTPKAKNSTKRRMFWIGGTVILGVAIWFYVVNGSNTTQTIEVKNAFTNAPIDSEEVKAVVVENEVETPVTIVDSKLQLPSEKDSATIVLKSPYYKDKTIVVHKEANAPIVLQPDDYPMMLKGFMKSDIKDWQTRKEQLQMILADDLEVIVLLKDNLGAEYFNKQEFSERLIVPSVALKKMKVVDIQSNADNKIHFIRIIQE
ncbi:MAG: hypothetical protein ACH34V_11350 [Flavobacterium sp.]|uniref:hypothetical protein n=1 Tax=Flavobacterium sp. TaxID=239 RepID=UPI003791EA2F